MAGSVFILGGTGQIGRALAVRLGHGGWQVTLASRGRLPLAPELAALPVRLVHVDRRTGDDGLVAALGSATDVLVDLIALRPEDGDQLVRLAPRVGSVVMMSTAGVYADESGLPLTRGAPSHGAIREDHPTVAPDAVSYEGIKVGIEQALLSGSGVPCTIIRPGAVYGPGDTAVAREWYFVKRALDKRRYIVLADRGERRLHQVAAANVAELVAAAAQHPATRVLNAGDARVLSVLEIARAISGVMRHDWAEVLVPGRPGADVGMTPWSAPHDLVLDTAAGRELGAPEVTTYAAALPDVCDWLITATAAGPWQEALPGAARALGPAAFAYDAEAALLAALGRGLEWSVTE